MTRTRRDGHGAIIMVEEDATRCTVGGQGRGRASDAGGGTRYLWRTEMRMRTAIEVMQGHEDLGH
jgi:hypothetical protein